MTKETLKKELKKAREKGDKEYEKGLLASWKNTYGEEYEEEKSSKK